MKSKKQYMALKRRRVEEWIKLSIGEDNCQRTQENGTTLFYTGMRKVSQYIFTRGDCKRYALLLANSFISYKPSIYRLSRPDDWGKYHYVVYMLKEVWDAEYPKTIMKVKRDLQCGYKLEKVAITRHGRIEWLDRKAEKHDNNCNMEHIRLIHEMCPHCGFMTHHHILLDTRNGEFKVKGSVYDKIDLLNDIFNKEIDRAFTKDFRQRCHDYYNLYGEPLLDYPDVPDDDKKPQA